MDINEDGNAAFSECRSETLDFWEGLMKSALCADDQSKSLPPVLRTNSNPLMVAFR